MDAFFFFFWQYEIVKQEFHSSAFTNESFTYHSFFCFFLSLSNIIFYSDLGVSDILIYFLNFLLSVTF